MQTLPTLIPSDKRCTDAQLELYLIELSLVGFPCSAEKLEVSGGFAASGCV